MRSRFGLRLTGAVVLGVLTAALVFLHLEARSLRPGDDWSPVVVAATTVAAGSVLTPASLAVQQWPRSLALPGSVPSVGEAAGQRVTVSMVPGQPLFTHQLQPAGAAGGMGLTPGMRLITIAMDEETSVGYRLQPGDRVDVVDVQRSAPNREAQLAVQAIEVFAVGLERRADGGTQPRTVTLLVTPQEALILSLLAADRPVRLLLRAPGDLAPVAVAPVRRSTD